MKKLGETGKLEPLSHLASVVTG